MTSLPDLRRLGLRLLVQPLIAPALAAAVLLTACGGNTSQVEAFLPDRVIALGDENSVIVNDGTIDGFRYTINDRRSTEVGKCRAAPIIVQSVASQYNYVFAECNPANATPRAFIHAKAGALVEDPINGLVAQRATVTNLGSRDLVTVMIGGNDIIALYEQVRAGSRSRDDAITEAQRRGRSAAATISEMLATGARALVITTPDVSLMPYGGTAAKTDSDALALLSTLTYEFNGSLRTSILPNDGRHFGLVLADDIVAVMRDNPTTYLESPYNVTDAACTTGYVNVKDCQLTSDAATTTLVSGATLANYLWASDRHIGPAAHLRIGQQAVARAVNNPF